MSNQAIPLAHWKFDESGFVTEVADSSEKYPGVADSVSFTSGVINNAADFSSSSIDLQTTDILTGKSQFSFTFWVKIGLLDEDQLIFGNINQIGNTGGLVVGYDRVTASIFFRCVNQDNQTYEVNAETMMDLDKWAHVMIVVDGTNSKVFINNVEVKDQDLAIQPSIKENSDDTVKFGANNNFFESFTGSLDDFRLFEYPIDRVERDFIWNNGRGTQNYKQFKQGTPFGGMLRKARENGGHL